jgi:hypothetical protein
MDAMLLYSETPNLHTHTLKVAIIDPSGGEAEFDFDAFRRHLGRRLHLLEPLRYKLVDIPWRLHHPMWLENCEVDLDYHLRRVQVPAPGGRRELDDVIGKVASTPLDRSHPLWEFHFAEGLARRRRGIHPSAPPHQGARRSPGPGGGVRRAPDLPQSRRVAAASIRHCRTPTG